MPYITNFIINGVLCFLSTARHTHTEQALLSICFSFYNAEKISEAKEVLFSHFQETPTKRRGEARARAELIDILTLLNAKANNESRSVRFVADSFDAMTPLSGYELIADHISGLIAEISELKNEVRELKNAARCPNVEHLTDLKEDLSDVKRILQDKLPVRSETSSNNKTYSSVAGFSKGTVSRPLGIS